MSYNSALTECRCTILLNVLSYDNKQPAGIVRAAGSKVSYSFQNLTQLLMYINEITSHSDILASSKKEDVFAMARGQNDICEKESWHPQKKRTLSDFRIDIYFRNFGAWQGEMTCMDSGRSGAFRSVIEMMLMLDSELESALATDHRKEADA